MNGNTPPFRRTAAIALGLILVLSHSAYALDTQPVVLATSGFASERGVAERRDLSAAKETQATPKRQTAPGEKANDAVSESLSCCAHYVYDGYTELFDDFDHDGFYTYLRVNVDIDTDYFDSDVYMMVFLRGSVDDWQQIYESEVFTIYGSSADDDYEVETELIAGFAPDYYEVLVEVYDANSDELVVSYGALENSSFDLLPMEDIDRDSVIVLPVVSSHGSGGGGSLSIGVLTLLLGLTLLRRRNTAARKTSR